MKLYIGCSGWNYRDWRGKFYPQKLAMKHWLNYYSGRFYTVEVNNTFYRQPEEHTLQKWFETTSDSFRFTLKANRFITHIKKLEGVRDSILQFEDSAALLGHKLGCLLWQLPPWIERDDEKLSRFCAQLDPHLRHVIEFRHGSWYDETVFALLRDFNIAFCSLSSRGYPDEVIRTSNFVYIRFHGKGPNMYNYNYSVDELRRWKEMIAGSGAESVYAYFNNDIEAHAPHNARQLHQMFWDHLKQH